MSCIHDEKIDPKGLSVCSKCGEVKQYNQEHPFEPPVIIQVGVDPDDNHHKTEVTVEQIRNGEGPFSMEELSTAKLAGVKLEVKSKKELKRRRHEPNGKLKKVKCTFPGCNLGPDGGRYECDPRAMHLHVMSRHLGKSTAKRRTPASIVEKILKLWDEGMSASSIISTLEREDKYKISSGGLYGVLTKERPNRKKYERHKVVVNKSDQNVDPNALLLEVMKLIVDNAPPEQIRAKALEVKKKLSACVAKIVALTHLVDETVNYLNVIMGDNGGEH